MARPSIEVGDRNGRRRVIRLIGTADANGRKLRYAGKGPRLSGHRTRSFDEQVMRPREVIKLGEKALCAAASSLNRAWDPADRRRHRMTRLRRSTFEAHEGDLGYACC